MIARGVIGNNRRSKKAELKITFGLIFTLILIVFFVIFAFASIRKSVVHHDEIIAAQFLHDLDVELQDLRNHEQGFHELNYELPEDINHVYFEAEPEEEVEEDERQGVWVHFNNTRYPGRVLYYISVPSSGIGEDPLILNVTNSSVKVFLVKRYRMQGAAVSADGELAGKVFYAGAPQDHGTYDDIMAKGASGEWKVLFNINFEDRPYLGKWETQREFRDDWNWAGWGNRGEDAEVVLDPSDPSNQAMLITFPFWDPSVNETWVCWHESGRCADEEGRRIHFTNGYYTERDPSLVDPSGEPTFTGSRTLLDNVGPGSGGMSITIPLGRAYEDVYLSYNIKYEPDWAAPAGGKLPGFKPIVNGCPACAPEDCMDEAGNRYNYEGSGGVGNYEWTYYDDNGNVIEPDGIADDFSARHMFQTNDHISYYYYDMDKTNKCGDSGGVRDSMIFDGDWHNIILRVKMNDHGVANGITQTWIDGESRGGITDHLFRTEGSTFGIGSIAFSNFFGGSGMHCIDIEHRFDQSCANGEWWNPESNWIRACAVDPDDPCMGVWKFENGSTQSYWGNRKTEYIHFDDIVAYVK